MTAKLSVDQQKAVDAHGGLLVKVEHPGTHQIYVIVDSDTHERAMRALQEQEDLAAIGRGLDDRAHGREQSLAEVDAEIREEFGFPARGK